MADIVWAAEAVDDSRLDGWGWLFSERPMDSVYALQQDHGPDGPDGPRRRLTEQIPQVRLHLCLQ